MLHEPMRITAIRYQVQTVPFRFAFRHAGASRSMNETVFVAVETNRGILGYGECIPRPYLTGETIADGLTTLEQLFAPRLAELRFPEHARPDEILRPLFVLADERRALAAYGALDMAVYDAWARHFRIPMTRMFNQVAGEDSHLAALTAPIGLGMPTTVATHLYRRLGFRRFKVKIHDTDTSDAARVARVRAIVGPQIPIVLDANGSLGEDTAEEDLLAFAPIGIAVCEEPLAARRFREMVALERRAGVPLMADESLCTTADADALTKAGGIRWWNLRLAKNGGFTGVLTLGQRAREHGVQIQLGALVGETSLLTAAAAAVLPALQPTFAESSFPQWLLRRDPFINGPRAGAFLRPRSGVVGLGVTPQTDPTTWQRIKVS